MPSVMAQDSDMGLAKLSAADESRYREILSRTVDPSWLNLKKIQSYKKNKSQLPCLAITKAEKKT
jgi:hypothetical protein